MQRSKSCQSVAIPTALQQQLLQQLHLGDSAGDDDAAAKRAGGLHKRVKGYVLRALFRMLWIAGRAQQALQRGTLALQLLLVGTVLLGAALVAYAAWHSWPAGSSQVSCCLHRDAWSARGRWARAALLGLPSARPVDWLTHERSC